MNTTFALLRDKERAERVLSGAGRVAREKMGCQKGARLTKRPALQSGHRLGLPDAKVEFQEKCQLCQNCLSNVPVGNTDPEAIFTSHTSVCDTLKRANVS